MLAYVATDINECINDDNQWLEVTSKEETTHGIWYRTNTHFGEHVAYMCREMMKKLFGCYLDTFYFLITDKIDDSKKQESPG